jgi:hypothetical protein
LFELFQFDGTFQVVPLVKKIKYEPTVKVPLTHVSVGEAPIFVPLGGYVKPRLLKRLYGAPGAPVVTLSVNDPEFKHVIAIGVVPGMLIVVGLKLAQGGEPQEPLT